MNDEIIEKLYEYALKYDITTFRIESDDLKTNVWSLLHIIYISNKFKREIKKQIILNIQKYQVAYRRDDYSNDRHANDLFLEGYFTIDQLRDLHNIDEHIIFATKGEHQ